MSDLISDPTELKFCKTCGHDYLDHQACGHGRSSCLFGWDKPRGGCECELFVASWSAEPAPPSQVPWAGPVTYDQAYQRARNAGFTANDAHNAARSHPKATKPFPWRIEIKAPDDVSIVCGEFGGTSTQFSRIAECHTIDDARFIVACCNAWALRDEKPQPVVEKSSLSPVREEATPTPNVEDLVACLGEAAVEVLFSKASHHPDTQKRDDEIIAALDFVAKALPALLEASRRADSWKENYDAISDSLIKTQSQLRGSISERERLTAQNEATQKRCDEIKAALEAARHALTVSHGLTATDKPQAYEDSILHDGCDALQARDVQREVSWEIDNSKEIAMIDAVLPFTPQCPDCKSVLSRIVRPEGNTLSDEAFSREYGDWRCDTCPPNNATWHPYRVFWNARTRKAHRNAFRIGAEIL